MSKFCPLCNAPKEKDALFCVACARKIEKEYEVKLPERPDKGAEEGTTLPGAVNDAQKGGIAKVEAADAAVKQLKQSMDAKTGQEKLKSDRDTKEVEQVAPSVDHTGFKKNFAHKPKSKRKWYLSGVAIVIGLLMVVGFVLYGMWVRQNNLDKLQWDAAVKQQTIQGYIDYMLAFPKGRYYDAAEEGIRIIKDLEQDSWQELQLSDNSAALRDYMSRHDQSPYRPLIQRRLDSLEWASALNDNSLESYRRYLHMITHGDFEGEYMEDAERRRDMLTQTQRVENTVIEQLKQVADGFFTALSLTDADKLEQYLAEEVFRFFGPGGKREKIVGELLISGSKRQSPTLDFIPDLSGLVYEKTQIDHYLVNLPVQKRMVDAESADQTLTGYIVCMEVNQQMQILTITEDKPRRK